LSSCQLRLSSPAALTFRIEQQLVMIIKTSHEITNMLLSRLKWFRSDAGMAI